MQGIKIKVAAGKIKHAYSEYDYNTQYYFFSWRDTSYGGQYDESEWPLSNEGDTITIYILPDNANINEIEGSVNSPFPRFIAKCRNAIVEI